MIVYWQNRLWKLDMSFDEFENKQQQFPNKIVEIKSLTPYEEKKEVPICELDDYSIVRNLNALRKY
jgi:hypothetical protein